MSHPEASHPDPSGSPPQQPIGRARPDVVRRPVSVTAAAVICFVWAAFNLLFATFYAFAVAVSADRTSGPRTVTFGSTSPTLGYVWALLVMIVCIAMVWGGVAALRGRTNRILVITG